VPQVPRASDVARVVPSGQQRVSVSGGQGAIAGAIGGIAREVRSAAIEHQQRKDRYQLSQAKTQFLTQKVREDNAYDDDQDYDTVESRYTTNMQKYLEDAAQAIENPKQRREFLSESELTMAQGTERIKNIAKSTETDHQRAFITEGLEGIREAALTGDVPTSLETADELVASAVDLGYLSAEEGQAALSRWKDDTLVAKIETMAPEDRIEALSESWADNIPGDLKVKLQRQAKSELNKDVAMSNVDEYSAQGLSYEESLAKIAQIEDEDVRRETEQRLTIQTQQEKNIEADRQDELYNAYYLPVRMDGFRVADIPPGELEEMDPEVVESLYSAERQAVSRVNRVTDRTVLDKLYELYNDGDGSPEAVRDYFKKNGDSLSDSDFEQWSKTTNSDFSDMESDPVFTGLQQVEAKILETHGYQSSPKKRNELSAKYRREYENFVFEWRNTHEGKEPNGEEQRAFIDNMMLKVPTRESRAIFGDDAKAPAGFEFWREMDDDQKVETMGYLRSLDPVSWQDAMDVVGESRDPDKIIEAFMDLSTVADAP